MNHDFVIKMIQAKKLEYEALKEIMPEKLVNKISGLEHDMMDIMKECVISGFTGYENNKKNPGEPTEKKIKKVDIES